MDTATEDIGNTKGYKMKENRYLFRIEKYIPVSFTALAVFSCYAITFVGFPWFGFYNKAKYLLLAFVFAYIAYNYRFLKSNHIPVTEKVSLALYIAASYVASFLNLGEVQGTNLVAQCTIQCGALLANFLLLIIVCNKNRQKSMLEIYFWTSVLLYIASDLSVFGRIIIDGNYLIGTKFQIAYLHIRTLALIILYVKDWNISKKVLLCALIAETFLINIITGCATGLVGTVLFILFLFLYFKRARIVQNPFTNIIVLLVCAAFPFWYELIINSSFVKVLVEAVLQKQLTLTGRTVIYSRIPQLFGDYVLCGYGINSNMEICRRWGAINIQNGMLKVLMESGIVGAVMILILYFSVFWRGRKCEKITQQVLSAFLLVFSVLSSIEISIGVDTLAVLVYLSVLTNYGRKEGNTV